MRYANVSFDSLRSSTAKSYTYRIPDGCSLEIGDTVAVESISGLLCEYSSCEYVTLGYIVGFPESYREKSGVTYRSVVGVVKPIK